MRWRGSAVPRVGDSTGAGPGATVRRSSSGGPSVALASGGREVAVVERSLSAGTAFESPGARPKCRWVEPSLGPGFDRALASVGLASRDEMGGVAGLQAAFTCMSAMH